MQGLLRVSATLLALVCSAPALRAQELDSSWTDAPEQADEAPPPPPPAPPPATALPPPPLPPPWPAPSAVPPAEPRVAVELTGDDPRLRFEIYSLAEGANRKVPIHTCANPCRVLLPRGEYRVRVSGRPEQVTGDRTIEVAEHGSWRFSLPDRSDRSAGLALAITGTALLPLGLGVVFVASEGIDRCSYDCREPRERNEGAQTAALVGLGMMVVGAVLTPVGWSKFARNRKPRLEEPRAEARRKAEPRIGLGAAPVPGGATAAVWGRF